MRGLVLVCLALLCAGGLQARSLTAHVERIDSPVAQLRGVQVRLAWPVEAPEGELQLRAERVEAPALGYRFEHLDWRCPLQRIGAQGWRCDGEVRNGDGAMRLSIVIDAEVTVAELSRGTGRISLHRDARLPDETRIDLTRIPLLWTQALLSQVWEAAQLGAGEADAQLRITATDDAPLRIAGPVTLRGAGLDTVDGAIAAEGLDARLQVQADIDADSRIRLDGQLQGGALLFGTNYLALEQRRIDLRLQAQHRDGEGWELPELHWDDPGILVVDGTAALDASTGLKALDLTLHGPDLSPLRDGYLTGWLGMAGLGDLAMIGALDASVQMRDGALDDLALRLREVSLVDPEGGFSFDGLEGDLILSSTGPATSAMQWRGGALHSLPFGPARLPFASGDGALRLRAAVEVPLLGGQVRIDHLLVQPATGETGLGLRFGLALEELDVGQLSAALDWPAFTGTLSGSIPDAHYADENLVLDGGLQMRLFGGSVGVSALSMERPFGVLPTLSADIVFDDIDLMALTGAFDFGSISGKLDGRIAELRLVGWEAVAFDARLVSDRHPGVRQRISQRAVQDLTSVGNPSFVGTLQSELIGFFDDFGYARLGIACKLENEVCSMSGLAPAGNGFVIVEGSGLPRLTVLGFNRRVDWPMLLERLAAVGKGEVKAVVD